MNDDQLTWLDVLAKHGGWEGAALAALEGRISHEFDLLAQSHLLAYMLQHVWRKLQAIETQFQRTSV